ncbi:MAG: OmpA family protein [Methylococcales bacterium]
MNILATIVVALSVTSCAINPYSGDKKISNTAKAAAIGTTTAAVIGAGIGALVDGANGARLGATIAAGVGGLTGAGVGYYMDKQEEQLIATLEESSVRVERVGDNITLIMPGDITFKPGSAEINRRFTLTLAAIGSVLSEYDKTRVSVQGHTDSKGSNAFNRMLSQVRADNVAQSIASTGVNTARIMTRGHGESNPIADNKLEPVEHLIVVSRYQLISRRHIATSSLYKAGFFNGGKMAKHIVLGRLIDGKKEVSLDFLPDFYANGHGVFLRSKSISVSMYTTQILIYCSQMIPE